MASEWAKYVLATLNSQCILQICARFSHFSEMSLSWTWRKFSFTNTSSVTMLMAFKCGTRRIVSSLIFNRGIASINWSNDVITAFMTWGVWISGQLLIIILIISRATWCTRMKQPPWSSSKSKSEQFLNFMRISSLSSSWKSWSTLMI